MDTTVFNTDLIKAKCHIAAAADDLVVAYWSERPEYHKKQAIEHLLKGAEVLGFDLVEKPNAQE